MMSVYSKKNSIIHTKGLPSGPVVKNRLPMQEPQETWVQSLGWEDALEEEMANHSSILAWRIPMERGAWGLQSVGYQRVRHD